MASPRLKLHKGQQIAMDAKQRFIACVTGVQAGKTTIGILWLLTEIQTAFREGRRGDWLIVAPTVKILQQSTLRKFLEMMPADWGEYKEQRQVIELAWGDKIFVRSAEEPDYLEGMTVRGAWIDEAGQVKEQAWINIQARLAIHQGRAFITSTPYAFNWLKREIINKAGWKNGAKQVGEALEDGIHLIEWESIDNPAFPKEEFERARRTLTPEVFAKRYQGKYTRAEGLVYKTFNPDKHLVKPFALPGEWRRFGGYDAGSSHPSVVLAFAEKPEVRDKDGKLLEPTKFYLYREFYKAHVMLAEVAQAMNREPFQYILGDPSAAQEILELRNHYKVKRLQAADNRIEIGIERINTLLLEDRLFIFDGAAPNALREILEYHYPQVNPDKPGNDKPVDINDHAMDAMKYAFSRDMKGFYTRPGTTRPTVKRQMQSRSAAMRRADPHTNYF